MIARPSEALAATVNVSIGSTFRYLSSMGRLGFRTVSWWRSNYGLAYEGHVGQGRGEYNCAMIPVSTSFEGPSTRVVLTMQLYCTDSTNHTFRWAITDHREDRRFLGTGGAPSGVVLAQGRFTPWVYSQKVHTERFTFRVANLPETFYIYLWRSSSSYGNIHIYSASVRVYSLSGPTSWRDAAPYIYNETSGAWLPAAPYVMIRDDQGVKHWTPVE